MGISTKYIVAIVIVSYNPVWEKMRRTLESIILQQNVNFEIIIADDGSEVNLFERIENFFIKKNFSDYKLIGSKENRGTVENMLSGVEVAESRYIKPLSPGDFLYDELVLYNWIDFMNKNNAQISFGEYMCFNEEREYGNILKVLHHPVYMISYRKNCSLKQEKIDYVLLRDGAVGATFLCQKKILKTYLNYIRGKIKYTEDLIFRLMIIDNVLLHYYDNFVIWYEYGSGISTSKSVFWHEQLVQDQENCDLIILKKRSHRKNKFLLDYQKVLQCRYKHKFWGRFYTYIVFPGALIVTIKHRLFKTFTYADIHNAFYQRICREKRKGII